MSEELLNADSWQARYVAGKTGWDRGTTNPQLLAWLEADSLPPGSVLIPGCGRGHEAIELALRGFAVTAVDFAEAATSALSTVAERLELAIEIVQADVFNHRPPQPYDYIYEQTCLCAIDPEKWATYVSHLHGWLRPGGKLLVLFMQSGTDSGPPFHCSIDTMQALFAAPDWQWPAELIEVEHPAGMCELAGILTRLS